MKRLLSFPPISFTLEAFSTYGRCGVAQAAAALSYFLILTLFPLLMCVNYFIGLFHLSLEQLLSGLDQVLPDQALAVMQDYLAYASLNKSPAIVAAALVAIALSASAGLRALLLAMDKLYGLEHPGGLRRIALSVILSLLFLLTIYLSIVVIFTGDWFFQVLEERLPPPLAELIPLRLLSQLWGWLRYLLLFFCVLLLVLAVYRMGTPPPLRREKKVLRLTALLSAGALVACSVLFSWFIDMSSRYSLVYGSLASLIILLVWLYFCGNILLAGAVAGRVWFRRRDGS